MSSSSPFTLFHSRFSGDGTTSHLVNPHTSPVLKRCEKMRVLIPPCTRHSLLIELLLIFVAVGRKKEFIVYSYFSKTIEKKIYNNVFLYVIDSFVSKIHKKNQLCLKWKCFVPERLFLLVRYVVGRFFVACTEKAGGMQKISDFFGNKRGFGDNNAPYPYVLLTYAYYVGAKRV